MLAPAPEGNDMRGELVVTIRVVVRDRQAACEKKPVGGTRIAPAPRVPGENCLLDVHAGDPENVGLGECMIRPRDELWLGCGHGAHLRADPGRPAASSGLQMPTSKT